ncbi:MAG TPA: UDP-N-acetylmuramoyl-tripeptide--D-alanyl-D-alanine ligase [Candidatus Baltobacteraceae bacterium]|nr:UDP-N-acetylmuramoyl-tripeptide--D-alanyl-D-alanine ligase [Candidatus Baltobacteraceae bacterium]
MMLTLERAAAATSARVRGARRFPASVRVITDTRALQPGDTFLALRGEHFDGHAFIGDAVQKGAAAVVVDDAAAVPEDVPALVVADTKRAYMDLANAARSLFAGRVVAITGSTGKTTTKHLLAQLLAAHYGTDRVLSPPANENNEIGVSKLLLSSSPDQAVIVVEMGARHQGEIAELVQIAHPHIGVLTNIGEAHLEIFGSHEALARTKWGLFSGGAQAVLNANDAESARRAPSLASPPLWFGAGTPRQPGVWITPDERLVVSNSPQTHDVRVDVRLPGRHNRENLAAAVAAALLLGMSIEELAEAIPGLTLPAGRYQVTQLGANLRLIYDAYNANLSGMIATLDAFACEQAERRIAVLSSMAELGSDACAMHERVGAHAARSGVDILLVGGDYAQSLADGALAGGLKEESIVAFSDNHSAAQWLREHAKAGDAVLLKGSRKYKMEEIAAELRA